MIKLKSPLPLHDQGFVSIVVALLLMILVSLIVLGFAFLARQNAYQSQNRVLSTQAFYAAETGVNDAIDYIKTQLQLGNPISSNTNCDDLKTNHGYSNNPDNNKPNVSYTCVLYNSAPDSLKTTATTDQSDVLLVHADGPDPIESITIYWSDHDNPDGQDFAQNDKFFLPELWYYTGGGGPDDFVKNGTGIIRATLIPVYGGVINRDDSTNRSQTIFLYPHKSGINSPGTASFLNSANPTDVNQGVFANANCNSSNPKDKKCAITINNLNNNLGRGSTNTFYLRLRSIYRSSDVQVTAKVQGRVGNVALSNDQILIDATGKADNVLRRIQVRVPFTGNSIGHPEYAVETSNGLCKRLQVWDGGASVDTTGITGNTSYCQTH